MKPREIGGSFTRGEWDFDFSLSVPLQLSPTVIWAQPWHALNARKRKHTVKMILSCCSSRNVLLFNFFPLTESQHAYTTQNWILSDQQRVGKNCQTPEKQGIILVLPFVALPPVTHWISIGNNLRKILTNTSGKNHGRFFQGGKQYFNRCKFF